LVARLPATAALLVRIQTPLKNTKWATSAKGVANTLLPAKKIYKKSKLKMFFIVFREKKFVALKVVKSAPHYTETALDEIKLLKCVSVPHREKKE
jgi:hypothetical protein